MKLLPVGPTVGSAQLPFHFQRWSSPLLIASLAQALLLLSHPVCAAPQGSTHVPCTPSPSAYDSCTPPTSFPDCASIPQGEALVYRDENGVAHIEASTQEGAWRAMGYEEARDALLAIMANVKRARGESARFLHGGQQRVYDDIATRYYKIHLADVLGNDLGRLEELLSDPSISPTNQVFLNLSAYVEGVNAYRTHLRESVPPCLNPQEEAYKAWLDDHHYSWAYEAGSPGLPSEHEVTVFDVASQIAWFNNFNALNRAEDKDTNPNPRPSCPPSPPPSPEPPLPLTHWEVNNTPPFLANEPFGAGGSNSFYWMNNASNADEYMKGPFRGGHVADPHNSFFAAYTNSLDGFTGPEGGQTFAHIRVCHSDPTQAIEVFGWRRPGWGMFWSFFNRNVSLGGSSGSTNTGDPFLLKVDSLPDPQNYFDYDGNAQPLTDLSFTLNVLPDGADDYLLASPCTITLKSAGSFGLIPRTQAFLRKDCSTPPHDVPALVAYRTPYVPALTFLDQPSWPIEDPRHPARSLYRGAVGLYKLITASGVGKVREVVDSNEVPNQVQILAVDKNGRMFAATCGAIPQRGDDALIQANGLSVLQKGGLYDVGAPVPALCAEDQAYDWQFKPEEHLFPDDGSTPIVRKLKYLIPRGDWTTEDPMDPPVPAAVNRSYKPYIYLNPNLDYPNQSLCIQEVYEIGGIFNHPRQNVPTFTEGPGAALPANEDYENPGFATMSNNEVWFAYKKAFSLVDVGPPDCALCDPCVSETLPCWPEILQEDYDICCDATWYGDTAAAAFNRSLSNTVLTGTAYSSFDPQTFALQKNRDIIDYLARQREKLASAKMDCAEARSFAIDNRNYVPRNYEEYTKADGSCQPRLNDSYPPPVLNLAEMDDQAVELVNEAERERRFFSDLWTYLNVDWAGDLYAHPSAGMVTLKQVWVTQEHPPFWYPDVWDKTEECSSWACPADCSPQEIDMPANAALIDFLWRGSRIGQKHIDDLHEGLIGGAYATAVAKLINWGAPEFRNDKSSTGAALLLQYDLGFNAATNGSANGMNTEGRVWTPLINGKVLAVHSRFPDSGPLDGLLAKTPTLDGSLPTGWVWEEAFLSNQCYLLRFYQSYRDWRSLAFPRNPDGAVLYDYDEPCGTSSTPRAELVHWSMRIPKPPYSAIYVDPEASALVPKDALNEADINALVRFFLVELGGFTLKEGPSMSTTSKKTLVDNWHAQPSIAGNPYPFYYPLTRGLARVLLMQRLVEADSFNADHDLQDWGDIVKMRVYDFAGNPIELQPGVFEVECDGGGIRAVDLRTDPDEPAQEDQGFQETMQAGGGSDKTLLVLWPENKNLYPESFFINFPGTRQSGFDAGACSSPHFAGMTQLFANRELAPTHFTDYRCFPSNDPAFPSFPYVSPPPPTAPCPPP